ncbi:hypothetical protein A6M21_09870 [Desulfotomaculum copahuensis]|uniref:Uncharacterized protein n=1 Tax=Desulfotomaculum copahuensis TaxID=1838280 RepID=A0A1B7LEJ7_9FIRM|nr:hypothetical protein A6M21_09870 [Desulfotomaculum copahuensis]
MEMEKDNGRIWREKQKNALRRAAGIFKEACYPEFAAADDIYRWVRVLREEAEDRRRGHFVQ